MKYRIIIEQDEDGFWVAECPSLPGCVSQGRSREEVIVNIKEAIEGYIAALQEDKLPVAEENFGTLLVAVWASCPGFRAETASRPSPKPVFIRSASTAPISWCGVTILSLNLLSPTTRN